MLIANRTESAMQISVIGEIMGENEWTASDAVYMRAILDAADGSPLDVWVSSSGGSLDAAMAMRAMLAAYNAPVSMHTAGIVASAATLLLCVPNAKVVAERGSVFMVHTVRMGADGDARDMRKAADALDACDDEIMDVYRLRLKCGDDELRGMMEDETWLRSSEALELGLVDEIAGTTSGGYVAEPHNPEPIPEAVSARLEPRIAALASGIAGLSAVGETRVQAINGAAEKAVSGIAEAAASALAGICKAGESVTASVADELKAVRAELEVTRRAYDEQAQRCKSLDEAISRAYALCGGDVTGFALHDEQRGKSTFKLNI